MLMNCIKSANWTDISEIFNLAKGTTAVTPGMEDISSFFTYTRTGYKYTVRELSITIVDP